MPDENEQNALTKIKAYLDAGHSLDAIRQIGWASWIEHLEAKGYDLRTGQLALQPPEDVPPSAPPEQVASERSHQRQTDVRVSEAPAASIPICARCGAERVGTRPYCVKCPTKWPDGTPPGRPVEARTWRKSKWLWAAVGVGVLVVGLVILGSVAGAGNTSEGDDQSVLLDSNGETDNQGSLVESDEPPPSREPADDIPQLDSSLLDDCLKFTEGIVVATEDGSRSMGGIADLSLEAGIDPLTVLTSKWQSDLRSEYSKLRGARDDVVLIDAPTADFRAIKSEVIRGFDLILASEAPFFEGANSLNADLILEASDLITKSAEAFSLATAMIAAADPLDCVR